MTMTRTIDCARKAKYTHVTSIKGGKPYLWSLNDFEAYCEDQVLFEKKGRRWSLENGCIVWQQTRNSFPTTFKLERREEDSCA